MKKVCIIILTFILYTGICVFAEEAGYTPLPVCKPMPAYNKMIYRQEIEQLLTKELPNTRKELDSMVSNAYILKRKLLNKKNISPNDKDYIKLLNISSYENYIKPFNSLYFKIIFTTNKYLNIPITDTAYTEHYIKCYMNENNLSMEWDYNLSFYLQDCLKQINEYTTEVENHINYKLNSQYKEEIENAIIREVPIAQKEVDRIYNEALQIYQAAVSDKENRSNYVEQLSGYVDYIENPEFHLYGKLIDITRKYAYIPEYKTGTDWIGTLYAIITPYVRDNNLNMHQVKVFEQYYIEKQAQIEKLLSELSK